MKDKIKIVSAGPDVYVSENGPRDFEVWIEDFACIGTGTTPQKALAEAVANLEAMAGAIQQVPFSVMP